MLVLTRKVGESFVVGDDIKVTIIDVIGGNKVRVGIDAPQEVPVYREEIYDLIKAYADQRKRTTVKRAHVVRRRVVWSIKDARQRLERLVGQSTGGWVQLDLFLSQYLPTPELSRTALASSFGATLEMARDGLIELRQDGAFAPIQMRRREAEHVTPNAE